jgi:hypothetical protein
LFLRRHILRPRLKRQIPKFPEATVESKIGFPLERNVPIRQSEERGVTL